MGFWGSVWDPKFWLPDNITWDDFKSTEFTKLPSTDDLLYTPLYALGIMIFRVLFESFFMSTVVHFTGLLNMSNSLTETMKQHLTGGFKGKSDFKKLAEIGFNFTYHFFAFSAGLYVIWDQPQLKDMTECWRHWPMHSLSNKTYWYYMIQISRFLCLTFTHLTVDARRHDFQQMLIHHISTMSLLGISWTMNMVRVGVLVLVIHDFADIFIEFGKILRIGNFKRLLAIDFIVLMVVWTSTRLFYYPFVILRSVLYDAPELLQKNYQWLDFSQYPQAPRILMVYLCVLLALHLFWTYILINVALRSVNQEGQVDDVLDNLEDDKKTK